MAQHFTINVKDCSIKQLYNLYKKQDYKIISE